VDHEDSEQEAANPKNGRGRVRGGRRRRMRKELGVAGVSVHALPMLVLIRDLPWRGGLLGDALP
jgi:hypothetical protein